MSGYTVEHRGVHEMLKIKSLKTTTFALALLVFFPLPTLHAQSKITAEQAQAIGIDAYSYFYPLLSMDITRKQFTNIEPGKEFGKGPMNMFVNVPEYPPADFKGVVRWMGDMPIEQEKALPVNDPRRVSGEFEDAWIQALAGSMTWRF
ncbi:hypothetical protein D9M68_778090 [compost metagenome]